MVNRKPTTGRRVTGYIFTVHSVWTTAVSSTQIKTGKGLRVKTVYSLTDTFTSTYPTSIIENQICALLFKCFLFVILHLTQFVSLSQ